MGKLSRFIGKAATVISAYGGQQGGGFSMTNLQKIAPIVSAYYSGGAGAALAATAQTYGQQQVGGPGVEYGGGGGFAGGTAGDYLGAGGTGYSPPSYARRFVQEPEYYDDDDYDDYDDEYEEEDY